MVRLDKDILTPVVRGNRSDDGLIKNIYIGYAYNSSSEKDRDIIHDTDTMDVYSVIHETYSIIYSKLETW